MSWKPALAVVGLLVLASPAAASSSPGPAAELSPAPARKSPPAVARKPTAQERAEADRMDALARATFWERDVQIDPRDVDGSVKLAKALRELGRFDEAEGASAQALVIAPGSLEALMESARDYIAAGQGFFAIDPARRACALAPKDWRPPSLLAVALEQAERGDEALAAFNKALALAPANPATLSNLAMYEAAHGDVGRAEILLRQAVAAPGAGASERQNLALIVGLGGRLEEAERLERQDLPPETVANDLAYLRATPAQATARSWRSLATAR